MKLVSFRADGQNSYGLVTGEGIIDCGRRLRPELPDLRSVLEAGALGRLKALADEAADFPMDSVELLPVIPTPNKIIGVGGNYKAHLAEANIDVRGYPLLFNRFATSQVGCGQPIIRPVNSIQLDYEGELAVIIGTAGRRIPAESALDHVAGYANYNDGSIRDWQMHTKSVTAGKNYDRTGAFGPWLATTDEIPDPSALQLATRLNGVEVQQAPVSDLVFTVPELIAYISTIVTLEPGDVIITGTPSGVGLFRTPPLWLKDGDIVEVEISGLGILRNPVVDELSAQ